MGRKVQIDKDIVLDISPSYYDLPRKAKKREAKRIVKVIADALNKYIEREIRKEALMSLTGT